MSDRVFGGLGLLLAVFFVWQAQLIELSFISDPVGPRTFPTIIGTVLGLASLVIVLRPDAAAQWPPAARLFEIAMSVAVMIAYAVLLPELGFVIATALAASYLTWRLGTAARWSVVVGALTSLGIYAVFRLILGLSLARGPLGF
ncbi:MAG: tripartite tricarboxylate transporter TctB family protein [Burkholderiales bacterium]|nr:MAG: tripartite tricarboxylate transporter TctB family protein [Burkholderiales bacterium]